MELVLIDEPGDVLVEGDVAVAVLVDVGQQLLEGLGGDATVDQALVALGELPTVQHSVAIVVKRLEKVRTVLELCCIFVGQLLRRRKER